MTIEYCMSCRKPCNAESALRRFWGPLLYFTCVKCQEKLAQNQKRQQSGLRKKPSGSLDFVGKMMSGR
jgi:hypothetical protein